MLGYSEGLNLDNINETTPEEINANLTSVWKNRQPLYELSANALMLDFAPDFAKLHRWGSDIFGRPDPERIIALGIQNMHSYMMTGWETGILNSFHTLRRWGMEKQQLMEIVMFSSLYAGMRGLGHTYHAIGDMLAVFAPPDRGPAPFPPGWEIDNEGFKAGLDMTTRSLTDQDRKNITEWYEKTIGYLPNSYEWGMKYHPEFIKSSRARWENSIKSLPKQVVPFIMLRHNTIMGSRDGLRESALLGKAWGMTSDWITLGITATAFFFTGFEGLYAAHDAVEDIL
jgi:hypothetical protein